MTTLDDMIDEWVRTLGQAELPLKPHLDEIADHVRTDALGRIGAGAEVPDAFAAAIGSFGAPREVAREFLKSEPSEERTALRFAVVYIVASLLVTAAIVGIDKVVIPLDSTLVALVLVFVVNPLLAFILMARRGLLDFYSSD